jgi:hypothetical protein
MGPLHGVNFGSLNIRFSLVSAGNDRLDSEVAQHPLLKKKADALLVNRPRGDQAQGRRPLWNEAMASKIVLPTDSHLWVN